MWYVLDLLNFGGAIKCRLKVHHGDHACIHSVILYFSDSDEKQSTKLRSWNPLETDFLADRNNYSIDDEDVGVMLDGYSKCSTSACTIVNVCFDFGKSRDRGLCVNIM